MNHIAAMSPSIRLLIVFFLILILIRRKVSLGTAFLSGAVALNLLFGMGPVATLKIIGSSALLPDTWLLSVMVAAILIFSQSMEITGQMQRMLGHFKGLIRKPGLNLAVFPALIGLLPMPGGAVFSAPMVRELGEGMGLSGQRLSLINYWFRHIWEYWWPLYPGVLLAIALSDISMGLFIQILCPFSLVAMFLGYVALLKPAARTDARDMTPRAPARPFFRELLPVLIIIGGGPLLGLLLGLVLPGSSLSMEAGLITCLVLATAWVWITNKTQADDVWGLLKRKDLYTMLFMIFSVLAFKNSLEGSDAVSLITQELLGKHIPVSILAVLLPLFVGLITGISVAFVGISMPILIPLIVSSGDGALLPWYTMLIMTSGFCGVLLSPLHLCFILSHGYFKAPMGEAYKVLIPLAMAIGILGMSAFYVRALTGL